ncbi:PAS domain-containing sensor histidine kinase [Gryllotalpicola protaetiae]|uniref:histidine kinase n=1 Tax=Gryllotalpicola protaetiae TaxID=2419771 RepID=A0A387BWU5_9MICO|nr:PAS domain-containing sensor histidine kinase [Gryllotalpicola protaetiae]AYG05317.1 PAS domain-containing sensor histidine kinase [Gryllotalpicola protaetiae]
MTDVVDDRAHHLEELIPVILAKVPQPVWLVDAQGNIQYSNPAALAAVGYSSLDEVFGRNSHQLVHHSHPDGTPYPMDECPMLAPSRDGRTSRGEEWFIRKDGTFFPIAFVSAPIELPGGRGTVLSFADVSERYALQRSIRERDAAELLRREAEKSHRRLMEGVAAARRQIVRDLHDGAQQRLVNLTISLGLLSESLGDDRPQSALLAAAREDAQAAIAELRQLAAGIHPPALGSDGLVAALEALRDRSPIPVHIRGGLGQRRLPPVVELNAYFIVSEALTNAAKHARATSVTIDVDLIDETLVLAVIDDGAGIDHAAVGSGLQNMSDRAAALAGRVAIESSPGRGTCVRVWIPASA